MNGNGPAMVSTILLTEHWSPPQILALETSNGALVDTPFLTMANMRLVELYGAIAGGPGARLLYNSEFSNLPPRAGGGWTNCLATNLARCYEAAVGENGHVFGMALVLAYDSNSVLVDVSDDMIEGVQFIARDLPPF